MQNSKIKVIKRADARSVKSKKKRRNRTRDTAREMVATVSDWVADIKERNTADAKAAFDMLFSETRQPAGS